MAAVMITPRNAARPAGPPRLVLVDRAHAIRTPQSSAATYRRRRVAMSLLGLAMVIVAGRATAGAVEGSPNGASHRPPSTATYIVQPGDSLWAVAERLAPGGDPRPVVDALSSVRHNAALVPGEQIVWPTK